MSIQDQIFNELAYEIFAPWEMKLFDVLKADEDIWKLCTKVRRRLIAGDIPEVWVDKFIQQQLADMRQQLNEQGVRAG